MSATTDSTLSKTANLEEVYKKIETPLHAIAGLKIVEWKNDTQSMGRRITCGLALASLAIVGLIDIVAGIAFGILTSPGELAGYKHSRHFFYRAGYGGMASLTFLTIFQYENIKGSTMA